MRGSMEWAGTALENRDDQDGGAAADPADRYTPGDNIKSDTKKNICDRSSFGSLLLHAIRYFLDAEQLGQKRGPYAALGYRSSCMSSHLTKGVHYNQWERALRSMKANMKNRWLKKLSSLQKRKRAMMNGSIVWWWAKWNTSGVMDRKWLGAMNK